MSILPQVKELGYQVQEVRFVDESSQKSGGFSANVFVRMTNGRFTCLPRSDLAATIYHSLNDQVDRFLTTHFAYHR
jgi:hypothetical protein